MLSRLKWGAEGCAQALLVKEYPFKSHFARSQIALNHTKDKKRISEHFV